MRGCVDWLCIAAAGVDASDVARDQLLAPKQGSLCLQQAVGKCGMAAR